MKKSLLVIRITLVLMIVSVFRFGVHAQVTMVLDSVIMGPSYANEVYYNMQNGIVSTYPRNSWDIAFRTMVMSSSIITNDGSNVMLYTYPKADTSGWTSIDTTGWQTWAPLYNGVDDWENGAFMRNAKGGLDFGWGIYNTSNHFITGDSLYVIKLRNGSFKKLWMQVKKSGESRYIFRYAQIDGTEEQIVTLNCSDYLSREFIGYSLQTDSIIDFQPVKSSWDLVFTKYIAPEFPDTVYNFMGIQNNAEVYAEKFLHVAPEFIGYNPYVWDSTKISIGHNWKTFSGGVWSLTDSLAYFVKTKAGDVYKLVITGYEGSSSGKIVFRKAKIARVGINEQTTGHFPVVIFPNPASEIINVRMLPKEEETFVVLADLSGRTIISDKFSPGTGQYFMETSKLQSGVYLLKFSAGSHTSVKKVIISR